MPGAHERSSVSTVKKPGLEKLEAEAWLGSDPWLTTSDHKCLRCIERHPPGEFGTKKGQNSSSSWQVETFVLLSDGVCGLLGQTPGSAEE